MHRNAARASRDETAPDVRLSTRRSIGIAPFMTNSSTGIVRKPSMSAMGAEPRATAEPAPLASGGVRIAKPSRANLERATNLSRANATANVTLWLSASGMTPSRAQAQRRARFANANANAKNPSGSGAAYAHSDAGHCEWCGRGCRRHASSRAKREDTHASRYAHVHAHGLRAAGHAPLTVRTMPHARQQRAEPYFDRHAKTTTGRSKKPSTSRRDDGAASVRRDDR